MKTIGSASNITKTRENKRKQNAREWQKRKNCTNLTINIPTENTTYTQPLITMLLPSPGHSWRAATLLSLNAAVEASSQIILPKTSSMSAGSHHPLEWYFVCMVQLTAQYSVPPPHSTKPRENNLLCVYMPSLGPSLFIMKPQEPCLHLSPVPPQSSQPAPAWTQSVLKHITVRATDREALVSNSATATKQNNFFWRLKVFFGVYVVQGIEPKVSCMQGKNSTTKPHSQSD